MKKNVMCIALATALLAMAIPAFAESNSAEVFSTRSRAAEFSATTINKGYTFKDFERPTGKNTVGVTASEVSYKDNNYDNFRAYTCNNSGTRTCTEAYVRVYENQADKDLTLNSTGTALSYFNLRVDNVAYREGGSSTNTLSVVGVAKAK